MRELLFFAPAVLILGIWLGFIHPHANVPGFLKAVLTWLGIFVFVAVPEELFFRAWVQNFLERRIGRRGVVVGRVHFVRAIALQQAIGPLQLALRDAGDHRWNFLRPRLAPG